MTKVFAIIALLAMSYIASADVPTWTLPLKSDDLASDQDEYMASRCSTTDGKFYYIDYADDGKSRILQVWDSKTQTLSTPISLTNVLSAITAIQNSLGTDGESQYVLQCLGTTVYLSLAYTNSTGTGIQQFLVDPSGTVTSYTLPLTNKDLTSDTKLFLSEACQTTDGKLYYSDTLADESSVLQVWDSTTQQMGTAIPLSAVYAQVDDFGKDSGDLIRHVSLLKCIGTNVYVNFAYENKTASGVQLFLIQATGPVPTYALPLNKNAVPEEPSDYLTIMCDTSDGKYYYMDQGNDQSWMIQQWNSNTQASADSAPLTGLANQVTAYLAVASNDANTVNLLQCIGDSVYYNVAYSNGSATGIELFQVQKSAGMLSFSAALLAFVALLL